MDTPNTQSHTCSASTPRSRSTRVTGRSAPRGGNRELTKGRIRVKRNKASSNLRSDLVYAYVDAWIHCREQVILLRFAGCSTTLSWAKARLRQCAKDMTSARASRWLGIRCAAGADLLCSGSACSTSCPALAQLLAPPRRPPS